MSSPRIPIDVAEAVIDTVAAHEDSGTLARCVRVCKSWSPRSRYRLWHRLIISRGEHLPTICNTLARDTFLRSIVQIVRLEASLGSDVDPPKTLPIVAIMTIIQQLTQRPRRNQMPRWTALLEIVFSPLLERGLLHIAPPDYSTGAAERISEYGHIREPDRVVLSPSGRWAASTLWNPTWEPSNTTVSECIVWDSQTGKSHPSHWYCLADSPLSYPASPSPFAFCPTETHWAIASLHDITVFPLPVETASTSPTDHSQPVGRIDLHLDVLVMRLCWSRDGSQIFAQDVAAKIHIYDALAFTHLRTLSPPPIYTATSGEHVPEGLDYIRRPGILALSADERYLLSNVALSSSSTQSNPIYVWTLADGSCESHFLGYHDSAISGTDTQFYATAIRQHSSPELEHPPHVVTICRNGTLLTAAVGSPDGVTTIRPAGLPADLQSIQDASFSSDGMRVLFLGAKGTPYFLVVDTLTGATIASLDCGHYPSLFSGVLTIGVLSGDGQVVAIGDERLEPWLQQRPEWWLWRLEDGTLRKAVGHEDGRFVRKCALSRDGSVAGFGTTGGDVFFRNVGDR
ncbi:uncharacterized protein BXZ73DRAFT_99934 [Epithele typhae]|uniref:uncharacterized protein n=1 Tax=Epithele typhae TaxID=378194 RepID=UPI0020081794|nr:uncharacterized protein BXZ73DRAFT_99934 [Epithele typhae]KAH9938873.1 hypothetical protein BXZ73DRAFT_99934 [Epithele typhae]